MNWDMDTLHLSKPLAVRVHPIATKLYLGDDYDLPWNNKANNINLERMINYRT